MASARDYLDDEDDESEWGLGVYTAVAPIEPDGERLTNKAECRKSAQKVWDEIQRRLREVRP